MESLPTYLLWSFVGTIVVVSLLLGGLMVGLALAGRKARQSTRSGQSADKLLEIGR